ncbi:ubiquitin-conjugating enzyme/RWD-like protein [Auriculariales sp. MPI-PUGE-AT-0066]|nr:ubiquitin-conjugating enzyme/RWD-like protein [Auriculariales sp. MPI-PUGE-AT-0066]
MATNTQLLAKKRIAKELADIQRTPEDLGSITLGPVGSNLFEWEATLPGPEGSPYEGGRFVVRLSLPPDYPFSPPKATFITRIFHMNIGDTGAICIDILKSNWSPALSLLKLVLSLSSLLTDPNPKDPLVPAIAQQYNRSRKRHDEIARDFTRAHAMSAPATASPNREPAPPALPIVSSLTRARGPRGARPRQGVTAASTSAGGAALASVIEIDDSEDEPMMLNSSLMRGVTAGRRRTRAQAGVDAEAEAVQQTGTPATRTSKRIRTNDGSVQGGSSQQQQEIIVID